MTNLNIGQTPPVNLTVTLVAGAPFTSRPLTRSDGTAWATPPALTFEGGTTWTAELSDDDLAAVFTATPEQVDAVGSRDLVALHDPDTGHVFARGRVTKVDGVPA